MRKIDKPVVSIVAAAETLGITIKANRACCFNGTGHRGGEDRNPSLVFLTRVNRFQCYTCGVKGDVIDLVRFVRGCNHPEALQWISSHFSDAANTSAKNEPTSEGSKYPSATNLRVYQRLYEFTAAPESDTPGGEYLRYQRQIKPKVATRCHVREILDAESVCEELQQEFTDDELKSAGLLSQKGNFQFRCHPLLFFYMAKEIPQYVMARSITDSGKCKELALRGIKAPIPYLSDSLLTNPDEVILTEGHIDALSAVQLGYTAVAVPGVTRFNQEWFQHFKHVKKVIILFDNDDAGKKAATELRAQFRLNSITADTLFPANHKDLNEILKHHFSKRRTP